MDGTYRWMFIFACSVFCTLPTWSRPSKGKPVNSTNSINSSTSDKLLAKDINYLVKVLNLSLVNHTKSNDMSNLSLSNLVNGTIINNFWNYLGDDIIDINFPTLQSKLSNETFKNSTNNNMHSSANATTYPANSTLNKHDNTIDASLLTNIIHALLRNNTSIKNFTFTKNVDQNDSINKTIDAWSNTLNKTESLYNTNGTKSSVPQYETGNSENVGSRTDVIKGNNHASISTFDGSISKTEFGTVGDRNKLNGTRNVTMLNETREFEMGKNNYTLTNLTSHHNCSGCLRNSETDGPATLDSYNGTKSKITNGNDEGSANGDESESGENAEKITKRCKSKKLLVISGGKEEHVFDMLQNNDVEGDADSNTNCITASRRRLITNNKTHRKVTHSNGTVTEKDQKSKKEEKEKDDKKEEEKNKERQKSNEDRAKSNEDRAKDLELTKYKILNGIHDEPPPKVTDEMQNQNVENQTMVLDPSMLPNNETVIEPDPENADSGAGMIGMDTHPAIEPSKGNSTSNKTKGKTKKHPKKKPHKKKGLLKNGTQMLNSTRIKQNSTLVNSTKNKTLMNETKTVEQSSKKRILCFGDSLTEGYYGKKTRHPYTERLEALLSDDDKNEYEVLNHGVKGECAGKQMQTRLPKVMKEESPLDLIIILAGTNDLFYKNCSKHPDPYDDVISLHKMVHDEGIKSVVVTLPEIDLYAYRSINSSLNMTSNNTINSKSNATTNSTSKEASSEKKDSIADADEIQEKWNELNQKLRLYVSTHKTPDKVILCDVADEFSRQSDKGASDSKKMWADYLHPSPEGYDRMGSIIYKDIKGKF